MTDNLQRAKEQGMAQFDSIKEMVEALRAANNPPDTGERDDVAFEEAEQTIHEDALSVQVRSGWYSPGSRDADTKPAEYEILLCTGGPACRIIGTLSEYGEPEDAKLQVQDWFTPWTDLHMAEMLLHQPSDITPSAADEILLDYARCFYFGE